MKLLSLSQLTTKRAAFAAVALAAGLVVTTQVGRADTGVTLSDADTYMVAWHLRRMGPGSFGCSGTCRTQTAAQTYRLECSINLPPRATIVACLTDLAAACVPAACANQ